MQKEEPSKENRKIINATPNEFEGIKFKSKLEVTCYKKLVAAGFVPKYESETYYLLLPFSLTKVRYFCPYPTNSKNFIEYPRQIARITYTPDFIFNYKGYHVIFDVKGQQNDTYPIKKKIFLSLLENAGKYDKVLFFEPHSTRHITESIELLKSLPND